MFLHVSVILSTGGAGVTPPGIQPPRQTPLLGQIPTPSPQGRPLQRMVRILLECILVLLLFFKSHKQEKSVDDFHSQFVLNVSSGGSRISLLFGSIYGKNRMKIKVFGPRGGPVSLAPLLVNYSRCLNLLPK